MAETKDHQRLAAANVSWSDTQQPRSLIYDDIYYSSAGGLAETEHVFLAGNGLPKAWMSQRVFSIGELGFGTGLNFLVTWKHWLSGATSPTRAGARLHYFSCEKHPLDAGDQRRALSSWPELKELHERLSAQLPPNVAGFHRLHFPQGNVFLTLAYGDALESLGKLSGAIEAWFFDGFSPNRNPELWSKEIFAAAAARSASGATFATYSSTTWVRENLAAAGFSVEVATGFGNKRRMLRGTLTSPAVSTIGRKPSPETAIVIGAGLAGSMAVYSLAQRGVNVTLLEQESAAAMHASGNTSAIFMPRLARKPDASSRFQLQGFLHLKRQVGALREAGERIDGAECGVLRLPTSERLERLLSSLPDLGYPPEIASVVLQAETEDICGARLTGDAIAFPGAGWLAPVQYCNAALRQAGDRLSMEFGKFAAGLRRNGTTWQVLGKNEETLAEAEMVVLAAAHQCLRFPETSWLPLGRIRGQIARFRSPALALKTVVCYDGYIIPEHNGEFLLGATYDHHDDSSVPDTDKERGLHERLERYLALPEGHSVEPSGARVSFRANTPDRLPMIGPVPNTLGFKEAFLRANGGAFGPRYPSDQDLDGLYVSAGHGSHGLVSSALGADLIASHACGDPLPLEGDLVRSLLPARFLARLLRHPLKG